MKLARRKRFLMDRGKNIRITSDLSTETWQARKGWQDIVRALSEKNMQPRILYPARLSFRMDGETRSFQDQQKLKEYVTIKPALQEILKGFYRSKKTPRVIQNRNLQCVETKTSQAA